MKTTNRYVCPSCEVHELACECGHPEMRRLPDGVYWCPACGSEVPPVSPPRPGRSRCL
jgi:ribosomal protein L37AE/L43A